MNSLFTCRYEWANLFLNPLSITSGEVLFSSLVVPVQLLKGNGSQTPSEATWSRTPQTAGLLTRSTLISDFLIDLDLQMTRPPKCYILILPLEGMRFPQRLHVDSLSYNKLWDTCRRHTSEYKVFNFGILFCRPWLFDGHSNNSIIFVKEKQLHSSVHFLDRLPDLQL